MKNGGESQMAAGLMHDLAGDTVNVDSAGTEPGSVVDAVRRGVARGRRGHRRALIVLTGGLAAFQAHQP